MTRVTGTGQHIVSFNAYDKVDQDGNLILKVVVFDADLFEEGIEKVVLASSDIPIRVVTPTPTPSPTPTPTPSPTPDLRKEQVAVLTDSNPRIYESPSLDAEVVMTIPFSCPVVIVDSSNFEDNGDWHHVICFQGDAEIPGWVPEASIGVRRWFTRQAMKSLAVTIVSTDIYPGPTSENPISRIPQCTLLEIEDLAEGQYRVLAYRDDSARPMVGWVPIRDVKERPLSLPR